MKYLVRTLSYEMHSIEWIIEAKDENEAEEHYFEGELVDDVFSDTLDVQIESVEPYEN